MSLYFYYFGFDKAFDVQLRTIFHHWPSPTGNRGRAIVYGSESSNMNVTDTNPDIDLHPWTTNQYIPILLFLSSPNYVLCVLVLILCSNLLNIFFQWINISNCVLVVLSKDI